MITTFERFIAHRYLFSARREGFVSVISWFSFIGIALGVATLIVVMAVMNGFRQELFGALVSMRGHVSIHNQSHLMEAEPEKLTLISTIPGIRLAYPMLEQQAIAMAKGQAQGIIVQGLTNDAIVQRSRIQFADHSDAPLESKPLVEAEFKGNHIFLGRRLAELLNVRVGDTLNLLTPKTTATAFGNMPHQKTFKVSGLFHVGMRDFDRNFIFMPLETAQNFFKADGQWSQIDVFSAHDDLSTSLASLLQTVLDRHVATPGTPAAKNHLQAFDWRHSDAQIFQAVKMERNVMFLILTLIILIASFNIISGLTMMVKDKTRDIAILRTIGATKATILKIFFLTGASIGGIGTLLGVGLGLSFSLNIERIRQFLQGLTNTEFFSEEIYFLSTLPAKVDFEEVALIAGMSITLSFLATLYPSWRASCLDPVEGLRAG